PRAAEPPGENQAHPSMERPACASEGWWTGRAHALSKGTHVPIPRRYHVPETVHPRIPRRLGTLVRGRAEQPGRRLRVRRARWIAVQGERVLREHHLLPFVHEAVRLLGRSLTRTRDGAAGFGARGTACPIH